MIRIKRNLNYIKLCIKGGHSYRFRLLGAKVA